MAGFWRWLLQGGSRKPAAKVPRASPAAVPQDPRRLMEERLLRQVGGRVRKESSRNLPLDTPAHQKMARLVVQIWLRDTDDDEGKR